MYILEMQYLVKLILEKENLKSLFFVYLFEEMYILTIIKRRSDSMLLPLWIILCYFTLFFIVGTIIKNNSIVDIGWGLGFVVTTVILFISSNQTVEQSIVLFMIAIWGLRLFYHILRRNIFAEEDFRYKNWRKAWGKWVIPRAFVQVFMLQGILMYMIGSAAFYFMLNEQSFGVLSYVGIFIFVVGYYFEVVGDRQLRKFMDLKDRPKLLTKGLWGVTRHPNYTGEGLIWIGIFITVLGAGVPWYFVISPITINVVLRFISIPILEEKMSKREGWEAYANKVNAYIPWV